MVLGSPAQAKAALASIARYACVLRGDPCSGHRPQQRTCAKMSCGGFMQAVPTACFHAQLVMCRAVETFLFVLVQILDMYVCAHAYWYHNALVAGNVWGLYRQMM